MKKSTCIAGLSFLAVAGAVSYLLFTGPRMKVQPHIRAFQAEMPNLPPGVVPLETPLGLPAGGGAEVSNPPQANAENIARGKVYYGYYCQFCHGEKGDGTGPVGDSYVPRPADLRSDKVRAMSDGQLLAAMLEGVGHAPVLRRVVPPRHRGYLVLFVRSMAQP